MPALSVLVVEDDPAQRQMLRISLEARGHAIAGEVERGDDPMLREHKADVAVVDLALPGKSGIEVIRELRDHHPDLPVLVLSATAHNAAITEALLAGALGYVVKGARLLDVVDAVELVARKQQVVAGNEP
jgi:DNA-binding NarL/FixJ family response regulator